MALLLKVPLGYNFGVAVEQFLFCDLKIFVKAWGSWYQKFSFSSFTSLNIVLPLTKVIEYSILNNRRTDR